MLTIPLALVAFHAATGTVTLASELRSYPEIAKALSVDGKTVTCSPSVKDRAAIVKLTERTWDSATTLLAKGLGLQFRRDEKVPTTYWMEPDPAVATLEKKLFDTYAGDCQRDVLETLAWIKKLTAKGSPKSMEETNEFITREIGPAKRGEETEAWRRMLASDMPDTQRAAYFAIMDMSRASPHEASGFATAIGFFESGGKIQNLIKSGLTFTGTPADWARSTALGGTVSRQVSDAIQIARNEIRLDGNNVNEVKAKFDHDLGNTAFVEDVSFDATRGGLNILLRSFNPDNISLMTGSKTSAFTDLMNLSSNRMADLYKKVGAEETWNSWRDDTIKFRAEKEANAPFPLRPNAGGASDVVAEWAKANDSDVVMEWSVVRDSYLYRLRDSDAIAPGIASSLTLFSPRVVDRKQWGARGYPNPGVWAVEQSDGAAIFKSVFQLDRQIPTKIGPLAELERKIVFGATGEHPQIPLDAVISFAKSTDTLTASAFAAHRVNVRGSDLATVYPFLKLLAALPKDQLSMVKTKLVKDEAVEFGLSPALASALTKDIFTVSVGIARKDQDIVFLPMASHPGFLNFVNHATVKIVKEPKGGSYFFALWPDPNAGLKLPGGPSFGPVWLSFK